MNNNLTEGSVFKNLIKFSLPFLLSSFLQTFYGLADLFIVGQYNGAAAITAVSVGSQMTHMLTVIIVGLAMGSTVMIGRAVGAGENHKASKVIGNTTILFMIFSIILTIILIVSTNGIIKIMSVPYEAIEETKRCITVCFIGVPFITAYNVISSIFRGLGDSKRPMYFVAIAGVFNIVLDYVLVGAFNMKSQGAAIATVVSQLLSVLIALVYMKRKMTDLTLSKNDFYIDGLVMKDILLVGIPIAAQDGFIQISFLVITAIANKRGLDAAAAVGIVEKVICFIFLVPSAMLSSVSAIAAQNVGAGLHERNKKTLKYAIGIGVVYSMIIAIICQFRAENILLLFAKDEPIVITMGAQYLKSYVFDCLVASVHFCFSGYFCAYKWSILSFIHNAVSVIFVRIPGAYIATKFWPDNLYPMGLAPAIGSLVSAIICIAAYMILRKRLYKE